MSRKLKFILSDLHLGAGHTLSRHNPLEDFSATEALIDFLQQVSQESQAESCEIELIFNGDLFEFLQVPAVEQFDPSVTYPPESYLDSSESASIQRLTHIVNGHSQLFQALSSFARIEPPQRRITIIKGNHDMALFWPGVKSRLREVLQASGERASLLRFADEFVSRENIYVEHGHQQAEAINGYQDSFNPLSTDDPSQLYYPPGSHFVINFFNKLEPACRFADDVKPLTALIWYALHWDFDFACRALVQLIRGTTTPETRSKVDDALLRELENDLSRQEIAAQYQSKPNFRRNFHLRIHHYLTETATTGQTAKIPPLTISSDPRQMGRANQLHQQAMLRQAAELIAEREKAKVVIFGHSHAPAQEELSNGGLYINTGCWTSDYSDLSLDNWRDLFAGHIEPDTIEPRLAYARIDYHEDNTPQAQLHYFNATVEDVSTLLPLTGRLTLKPQIHSENFLERNVQRLFRFLGTSD